MAKLRRSACIVLVNLALLGAAIVVLELIFGAWFDDANLNRLNLVKGRSLQFDVSELYDSETPTVRYTRDAFGLRGDYGGDPARIDLLTLGGSTTDQRYVADGQTWQDVLAAEFARHGNPLCTANAGVDGQSTVGHIKNFEWWFPHVPGLAPKYVLCYVGINDLHVEPLPDADGANVAEPTWFDAVQNKSAVCHLVRTLYGTYKATRVLNIGHRKVDWTRVAWTTDAMQTDYEFFTPRVTAYERRLHELADCIRRFGAKPIFVTQPVRYYRRTPDGWEGTAEAIADGKRRLNGVDYGAMMGRFNDALRATAADEGAVFVDLAAAREWRDDDFYDYAHMTPRGARRVGEALHEALSAELSEHSSAANRRK